MYSADWHYLRSEGEMQSEVMFSGQWGAKIILQKHFGLI